MTAELKQIVANRIDALADELIAVSHDIHAHPELAFNEHHASGLLCNALTSAGLAVKRSAYGLETAFETEFDGSRRGSARCPARRIRCAPRHRPRLRRTT